MEHETTTVLSMSHRVRTVWSGARDAQQACRARGREMQVWPASCKTTVLGMLRSLIAGGARVRSQSTSGGSATSAGSSAAASGSGRGTGKAGRQRGVGRVYAPY